MSKLHFVLLLLSVLASCPSVFALFEDEAGKYERSIRSVGPFSHALWITEGNDRAIVVASQQNRTIASLKPKSGEIFWRRLLPLGERIEHISKAGELVFVLSRSDSGSVTLRAILSATGIFVNEVHLHSCSIVALLPFACDSKHCASVVCTDGVSAYGTKGQLLFKHEISSIAAAFFDSASSMATIFRVNQSHVSAVSLNLPSGASTAPVAEGSTPIPAGACAQHVVGTEGGAGYLHCFQQSPSALRVFSRQAALVRGPVSASVSNAGLCVDCGASASMVVFTSSSTSASRTVALPVSAAVAKVGEPFSVVKIYGGVTVQALCKGKDVRVHVSASESSPAVDFIVPWSHPCPDLMFADFGANSAVRLLLVSPSGAVGYFVNATARWVRHESLADVQEVQLLPLPSALTAGFKGKGAKPSLASRLVDSATSFFTKVAPQHEDEVELSEQLIVALTSSGQVFGIHSATASVLWYLSLGSSISLSRNSADDSASSSAPIIAKKLIVTRATNDPEVAVVGHIGSRSFVAWINVTSGTEMLQLLDYKVTQILQIPEPDAAGRHPVLLVDSQMSTHVVPDLKDTDKLMARVHSRLYIYLASDTGVTGHSIVPSAHGAYSAVPSWSFAVPSGSKLLHVSAHTQDEVRSPGRVAGDRSVLFKFLNAALIAVFSHDPETFTLHVFLIDAITGRTLKFFVHAHAAAPVSSVISEHSLTYSFWNAEVDRQEVVSLEIFTQSAPWNTEALLNLLSSRVSTSYSSFDVSPLTWLSRSFILPFGVRHMAATKSLLGVTTKDIIVATTTDQLVTINRRLIDPRRPDSNRITESDKEEGLIPYDPRLGIPHTSFLTQNSSIPRLRTVLTFPDLLESNSLVFGIGLDLLWIPVSPAKNFDMLRHDFSRVGLFVSVLALFAGCFLAHSAVARSDLKRSWA